MHSEFEHWLTKQKYAQFRPYFRSPSYWMIYDVKVNHWMIIHELKSQIIDYNWEEIISNEWRV